MPPLAGAAYWLLLLLGQCRSFKQAESRLTAAETPFKLKYAPSFGYVSEHAGKDPYRQYQFCHDKGFRAMFDNGLMGRPVEEQKKIAMNCRNWAWNLDLLYCMPIFQLLHLFLNKAEIREMLVNKMKEGVEVAKTNRCKMGACGSRQIR